LKESEDGSGGEKKSRNNLANSMKIPKNYKISGKAKRKSRKSYSKEKSRRGARLEKRRRIGRSCFKKSGLP